MRYEARLFYKDWVYGSGWDVYDELQSFDATDSIDWWLKAFEDKNLEMFEYVTDDNDDPIGDQYDRLWIMKLVEIDEDGYEKVIRSFSIWDSDLRGDKEKEI